MHFFVTVRPAAKESGRMRRFTCGMLDDSFDMGGTPIKPRTKAALAASDGKADGSGAYWLKYMKQAPVISDRCSS